MAGFLCIHSLLYNRLKLMVHSFHLNDGRFDCASTGLFFSQTLTSAVLTMAGVIMCVETQWAASSAAARKATSC